VFLHRQLTPHDAVEDAVSFFMLPVDVEKVLSHILIQRFFGTDGTVLFKTVDAQAELGFQSSVGGMSHWRG
jgi:hypothetical protein